MSNPPVETANPATPKLNNSPSPATRKAGVFAELAPLVACLRSLLFYLGLAIAFVLFCLVYQLPFSRTVSVNSVGDRALLFNYYSREQYEDFIYRWTQPNSNVRLPGVGQPPALKIGLELTPRPPDAPPTTVNYHINGQKFYTFELSRNERKIYEQDFYPASRSFFSFERGNLDFWLNVEPAYIAKGDKRPFGAVVSQIEIKGSGLFDSGRPVIPPWQTVAFLLAALAILQVALRRAGFGALGAFVLTLAVSFLLTVGIGYDRTLIGLSAPGLLVCLALGYIFLVGGLLFVNWWLRRRSLTFTPSQARWLGLIFLLAFVVRGVGINHPMFQVLDHGFRVHEAMNLRERPVEVLTQYYNVNTEGSVSGNGKDRSVTLGQWGLSVAIPYPPLFYLFDLPLAQLLYTDEKVLLYWTNIFALWWECSALFLVYILGRQLFGQFGNRSGLVGAALTGFFPLSFLMPSDGGYPTMLAQWFTLLFLALVSGWFWERQVRIPVGWKSLVGAGLALGLAMLAHTASMLLLLGFVFFLWIFLALWGSRYNYLATPVFLTGAIGTVFSFALYYGFYVWPLVTKTLPTLASKVGEGQNVGEADRTLKGFWPELSAHFHFFPFVLSVGVLAWLIYLAWRGEKKKISITEPSFAGTVLQEISRPVLLLLCAWFSVFLFFSIASLRINLLHKHMIFALPLFALLSGLAITLLFDYLQQKSLKPNKLWLRLAQLAPFALAAYFIAAGCYTWFIRVINYILPAGTG